MKNRKEEFDRANILYFIYIVNSLTQLTYNFLCYVLPKHVQLLQSLELWINEG